MTKSKIIMIVDDEEDIRDLVESQLVKKGFLVTKAQNGLEALERVHSVKPDLVILDINMPKMGGIEFYNKILTSDGNPEFPVIFLTSRTELHEHFKENLEVHGFIDKPFKMDALIAEINNVLAKIK